MSDVKKVVVVWSSPNVSGLTATAKDNFIKGIEREGATYVERLNNGFDMYY